MKGTFAPAGPWLFGKRIDLLVFGGSALASLALLALGWSCGLLEADSPEWTWLACVLAVDVAHVWSTAFRVYLDGAEVRRRPALYLGAPIACWGLGALAYAFSSRAFWTLLAYVAVFHFVRQQYGWVALYRRRAGERGRLDRWIDTATIYAATVYPLIHWHAHLPRRFSWFMPGDFVIGVAPVIADALAPVYWSLLALFVARQAWRAYTGQPVNWGKALVVATTWLCWWIGIVVFNGDFAFTVTNVLIHGVPYLALTYRYGRARGARDRTSVLGRVLRYGVPSFLALILLAAFFEELLWDRYVWHERAWLFGRGALLSERWLVFLVPLLATPQALHYALDGFIWKVRKDNPALAAELREAA